MTRAAGTDLLLVDDDALIRLLVRTLLEAEAWTVREAGSLGEARATLAAGPAPDVVVLDEGLPDGSGLELVADLRAVAPDVHVVLYSGTTTDRCPAGVDAVVRKDGPPDALLEHLASVLPAA